MSETPRSPMARRRRALVKVLGFGLGFGVGWLAMGIAMSRAVGGDLQLHYPFEMFRLGKEAPTLMRILQREAVALNACRTADPSVAIWVVGDTLREIEREAERSRAVGEHLYHFRLVLHSRAHELAESIGDQELADEALRGAIEAARHSPSRAELRLDDAASIRNFVRNHEAAILGAPRSWQRGVRFARPEARESGAPTVLTGSPAE